jgi:hypothetical protein
VFDLRLDKSPGGGERCDDDAAPEQDVETPHPLARGAIAR